jgi:Kef-type K+ transport system membrane component KefB
MSLQASAAQGVAKAAPLVTSTEKTEQLLFSILIQLVIMIAAARIMNLLFRRFGQPGVIGETVAGLLLGPSLLGHFFPGFSTEVFGAKPAPAIVILSQIGLIFLMFQIGTNFEFGHMREGRAKRGVAPLAIASVGVPFVIGVWLGFLSAPSYASGIPPLVYALFCGVALAITAVPVLGRILAEYGLNRHELGVISISAAAINDVTGWLLLAGVAAVATATFTPSQTAFQTGGVILFALICFFALRPAARWLLARYPIKDGQVPPTLMAILLVFIFIMGMCTFRLGIFAIFGGFAAGLLFHHDVDFVEAWRKQVGVFVLVFFLPIFFTFTGLRTNVLGLDTGGDLLWLLIFVAAATLGKIIPVWLAARASGYSGKESLLIGSLMNTRGLMELIVLNIGFETGFIPQKIFTMLVIMAVVTTLMAGPFLKILMPRLGLTIPKNVEA